MPLINYIKSSKVYNHCRIHETNDCEYLARDFIHKEKLGMKLITNSIQRVSIARHVSSDDNDNDDDGCNIVNVMFWNAFLFYRNGVT